MSLELTEEKMRLLAGQGGGTSGIGGKSPHEHAATQLLYPTVKVPKVDEKGMPVLDSEGDPIMIDKLEVTGRTELPNPSGTAVLVSYAAYCAANFRGNGANLIDVNDDYMKFMVSKDRKGRLEYTQVATGSALGQSGNASGAEIAKAASEQ